MGRPHSVGQSIMTQSQDRSHARAVFGGLACITGAVLVAAFVAPFYGALDRPVVVIDSGSAEKGGQGANNGIVVEQFDYNEPGTSPEPGTAQQLLRRQASPRLRKASRLRGKRTGRQPIRSMMTAWSVKRLDRR